MNRSQAVSITGDLLEVADVRLRVKQSLAAFLATKTAAGCADESDGLLQPVVSLLLSSGKRLRAAFCYWGWRGAGGADCDAAVTAASALELLHGCALIHDDVMDASALRRGQPAVHRQFSAAHRAARWLGVSEQFGSAAAILAGDLCLVWADELLRASGLPAESLHRAGAIYDSMREETIRGQYLDVLAQAHGSLRVLDAWRAAQGKTGASTTSGPLAFGAALAGASAEIASAFQAYAAPLGIAFQLRDDLEGAFGDPRSTGKPSGDDLRDGKSTVLLARAAEFGGRRAAARINGLLREGTLDAVAELRDLIEATGARASVEGLIAELGREASAAVDGAPIHPQARDVLQGLASALTSDFD